MRPAQGYPDLFSDWTDPEAWLAGLIWSDGCLHIEGNHKRVIFSTTDQELASLAGKISGLTFRRYQSHSNDGCTRKPIMNINIGHQGPVERLIRAGLTPRKSLTSEFPVGMPERAIPGFVRGYFDGNGCAGLYRNPSKTKCPIPRIKVKFTGAKSVLSGIQDWVADCGISPKKLTPAGKVWQLNYNHGDSLRLSEFMYSGGGPFLSRKRQVFIEGAAQPMLSR